MTALLATLALLIVALNITGSDTAECGTPGSGLSLSDLPGYVQFPDVPDTAYKIHEELATWNQARERCMAEGGHLAIVDSPNKIAHIKNMKNLSRHWLHVGIYKLVGSSQWARFDNGLPIPSVPWAYVNANRIGSCAGISMFVDGLVDYACTGMRDYFVCETRITGDHNSTESPVPDSGLIPTQSAPPNHTLPNGYVAYPDVGAAYKVVNTKVNWTEARKLCLDEGAQLALIDSVEKLSHVAKMLAFSTSAHVGIYRHDNVEWVSVRDGAVVETIPWHEYFPIEHGDVVRMHYDYLGLYNGYADAFRPYVCELPIQTS